MTASIWRYISVFIDSSVSPYFPLSGPSSTKTPFWLIITFLSQLVVFAAALWSANGILSQVSVISSILSVA